MRTKWAQGIAIFSLAAAGVAWFLGSSSSSHQRSVETPSVEAVVVEPPRSSGRPAAALRPLELPPTGNGRSDQRLELERMASQSDAYSRLPDDDRAWVLDRTLEAVASGQVGSGDHASDPFEFIDQLSGTRQFTVDERTEPYDSSSPESATAEANPR